MPNPYCEPCGIKHKNSHFIGSSRVTEYSKPYYDNVSGRDCKIGGNVCKSLNVQFYKQMRIDKWIKMDKNKDSKVKVCSYIIVF